MIPAYTMTRNEDTAIRLSSERVLHRQLAKRLNGRAALTLMSLLSLTYVLGDGSRVSATRGWHRVTTGLPFLQNIACPSARTCYASGVGILVTTGATNFPGCVGGQAIVTLTIINVSLLHPDAQRLARHIEFPGDLGRGFAAAPHEADGLGAEFWRKRCATFRHVNILLGYPTPKR
jgi:hypothetical protein